MMEDIDAEAGHWRFQMEGVELKLHLFDLFGSQELPQKQRKVGAVKKASGIQDTLTINEALEDNGNAAKKVCENFGCVVREHKNASPNYELRSQASIEAHEEKMQAIQKKLTGFFDKATTAELGKDLLKEAQAFNQKRNQHNKFDL
ncbi:hypothetical protein L3Y34_012949 [Caenorhabditis briggsae]|uniref:Uncharacterized protein n=1 Tax=Caenorhabditis briggsae TaxID=6238 RepID=A0AAE8ZSP0_CAEBR|nr:hypothetical protein L3Y34_012949 [Caenorhabditis briggsae]